MKKRKLISVIDRFFPKKNIILFNSFPDVSDNSLALYLYLISERSDITDKYRLMWAVSDNPELMKRKLFELNPHYDHMVFKKKSLSGYSYFFKAKYLITTHGYFGGISNIKSQTHINLWHGMPLKTIGKGMSQQSSTGFGIDTDYTVATSPKFKELMAFSFDIKYDQVLVTGLPRNDMLFEKGLGLNKLRLENSYSKVIIWMPTYRKSVVGDIRSDGNADGFGLKEMLFDNFDALNGILKDLNYLLIIKPHPMDELGKRDLPSSKNILPINDKILNEYNIVLYYLLADSDVLITDYSSVFVDYLLTGKPIAFACGDLNEYKNTRGFFFENLQDYMPGEMLSNREEFLDYIKNLDEINNKWQDKYIRIRNEFNTFADNKACERLCDSIWKR